MQVLTGNIWALATRDDTIVIPTNVGWKQSDGKNPMGKGLARDAARRWSFLPGEYGAFCQRHGRATPLYAIRVDSKWCRFLILFPTKPLDAEKPYLSWRQEASPSLIEVNLVHLQRHAESFRASPVDNLYYSEGRRILVPSLGAGEGGLPEEFATQLLARHLTHPSFVHVRYDGTRGG